MNKILKTFEQYLQSILESIAWSEGGGGMPPILINSRAFYMQEFKPEILPMLFDNISIDGFKDGTFKAKGEKEDKIFTFEIVPGVLNDFIRMCAFNKVSLKVSSYAKLKFGIETIDWSDSIPSPVIVNYGDYKLEEGTKQNG